MKDKGYVEDKNYLENYAFIVFHVHLHNLSYQFIAYLLKRESLRSCFK